MLVCVCAHAYSNMHKHIHTQLKHNDLKEEHTMNIYINELDNLDDTENFTETQLSKLSDEKNKTTQQTSKYRS